MKTSRSRSNDVLFISALAAMLFGLALLLHTTGLARGLPLLAPFLAMALGGFLLFSSIVRGASHAFFFGGLLFVFEGAFLLLCALLRLSALRAWPLSMAVAGLAGFAAGLVHWRSFRPSFTALSSVFVFLGFFFSLFSLQVIRIPFKRFVIDWWPSIFIAAGAALFVVYGIRSRLARDRGKTPAGKTDSASHGGGSVS